MASETSDVDPLNDGDCNADKLSTAIWASSATAVQVGMSIGKFTVDHIMFQRFDFDGPLAGDTIDAAKIDYRQGPLSDGVTLNLRVGAIKPDGKWDADGAFNDTNYPPTRRAFHLPMFEEPLGANPDPTVWVGDAPAFDHVITISGGSGTELSFGEGIAATYAVTGLVAQLQDAMDTYGAEPFKVCISIGKPYDVTAPNNQQLALSNHGVPSLRPTMTIEYSTPLPTGIAGEALLDAQPSINARVEGGPAVTARSYLRRRVTARAVALPAAEALAEVTSGTKTKGDIR